MNYVLRDTTFNNDNNGGLKMLKKIRKLHISAKRTVAFVIAFAIIVGAVPAFAFEDEELHGSVPQFESRLKAPYVTENKYLKLLENDIPIAEGAYGEQPTLHEAFIPGMGKTFKLEFLQEQTQDIRLELWDATDTVYLGLIAFGTAQGQWGILNGTQWYAPGEPTKDDISNRIISYVCKRSNSNVLVSNENVKSPHKRAKTHRKP
jgi:hypothetical protein